MSWLKIRSWVAVGTGVLLLALAIGVAIALASSPGSLSALLSRRSNPVTTPVSSASADTTPEPTPVPSPTPRPGQLGASPGLQSLGRGVLLSTTGSAPLLSADRGQTWRKIPLPRGSSGVAVDPKDANHMVAGGANVQVTSNGGASWTSPKAAATTGTYLPLLVSPSDGSVWFFLHNGRLLRTLDAGASWKAISSPQTIAAATMVAGAPPDQFFMATADRVLEFNNKAAQLKDDGVLPGGAGVAGLAYGGGSPGRVLARGSDGKAYLLRPGGWVDSGSKLGGPVAAATGGSWVGDAGAGLAIAASVDYSSDGGGTWTPGAGLPGGESLGALAAEPDGSRVYAYCIAGDLYSSTDRGRTWSLLSTVLRSP